MKYAVDTELYILAAGEVNNAMNVSSQCLEAVRIWMESKRLQLNPGRTEWLWVCGLTASRTMPSLVLDGVAQPQTDPVHNQGAFLNSCLLAKQLVLSWLGDRLHPYGQF